MFRKIQEKGRSNISPQIRGSEGTLGRKNKSHGEEGGSIKGGHGTIGLVQSRGKKKLVRSGEKKVLVGDKLWAARKAGNQIRRW